MRDIIVYAETCQKWSQPAVYAAQLSGMLEASLTGLFVQEPIPAMPTLVSPSVIEQLYADLSEQLRLAQAAAPAFVQFAKDHGANRPARWQVADGPLLDALKYAGNWNDLLLLGSGEGFHWDTPTAVGKVVLSVGLPCIIVPATVSTHASLETVCVAWTGSAESVRALHAALPLLKRAGRVVLLRGRRVEPISLVGWRPDRDVGAYLESHGITVEFGAIEVEDGRAGEELLTIVTKLNCDLLVMGAYGRSRFSEWMFGGVTRHVLENARLPVFMRH